MPFSTTSVALTACETIKTRKTSCHAFNTSSRDRTSRLSSAVRHHLSSFEGKLSPPLTSFSQYHSLPELLFFLAQENHKPINILSSPFILRVSRWRLPTVAPELDSVKPAQLASKFSGNPFRSLHIVTPETFQTHVLALSFASLPVFFGQAEKCP